MWSEDGLTQLIFLTDNGSAMQTGAVEAAIAAKQDLFTRFRVFERERLMDYIRRILHNAKRLQPRVSALSVAQVRQRDGSLGDEDGSRPYLQLRRHRSDFGSKAASLWSIVSANLRRTYHD
jgi:hypothetical protein